MLETSLTNQILAQVFKKLRFLFRVRDTLDVIRYLRPLCLCISTLLLSHYQYTKPVLSISALFNSPRSSKPRQLSLPSRLSHLLSPNLDDGSDRQSQEEDFAKKLDNLPEKNGIAPTIHKLQVHRQLQVSTSSPRRPRRR